MKTFGLFCLLFVCLMATNTFAATFTVTTGADNGAGSLREAIQLANSVISDDTIDFAPNVTNIILAAQIPIDNAGTLTINGNGADILTIDGGAGTNRIFFATFATVTIRGVTLSGGNGQGAAFFSSSSMALLEAVVVQDNTGYYNPNSPSLSASGAVFFSGGINRIVNSTISGNTGFSDCAGILVANAALSIVNTTVSGNSTIAAGRGSGAICFAGALSNGAIRNTTITSNRGNGTGNAGGGGILASEGATVDLGNTIVAGNTSANPGPDLYRDRSASTFSTSGGNLIGDNSGNPSAPNTITFPTPVPPTSNPNANGDKVGSSNSLIEPLLGGLHYNGGTTPTHALLPESLAINAGNNSNAPATDQRGFARIIGGIIDIGAYESDTPASTPTPTPTTSPTPTPVSPTPTPTPTPTATPTVTPSPTQTPPPTPSPTVTPAPTPSPTPAFCSYGITMSSQEYPASGGTGMIEISAQQGCPISASTDAAFITLQPVQAGLSLTVAPNTGAARTGTIIINGQNFTVNQAANVKSRKRVRFL